MVTYLYGFATIVLVLLISGVLVSFQIYYGLAIFEPDTSKASIILFVLDQMLAGMLFDLFEVFRLELPGSAQTNIHENVWLGVLLFVFRLLMGGILLGTLISMFHRNVTASDDERIVVEMEINGRTMMVNIDNVLGMAGGKIAIARQILEQQLREEDMAEAGWHAESQ